MKLFFFTFCFITMRYVVVSQTDNHHEHKGLNGENIDKFYLPLEFDADSLVGFDEAAALIQAKMNSSEEWMQKRVIAVLKRNYIDFHYGMQVAKGTDPTVQAPCTNPGFETGTLAGWTALQGANNNSQTMAGCCAAATTQAIIVGPGTDPNVPVQMVPPGGGNFAVRLGQTGTGGVSYRLNQTFTVTAANSVFVYKYAVILQDGGHSCTDQPFFNIKFETCNNVVIPCAQYQASAFGSACSSGDPSFITSGVWKYKDWQTRSFDLSAYIGQCVNIEFTVGGCVATQGAHPGYAYIDASCQPMTLNLNGTDIPVGQTTTNMCTPTTNTLCAPPGFTSYTWNGPGGATGQTSQCINSSTAGTYSVTLGMQGSSCQSPVLYSTFNLVPKPLANFTFTTTPCQSTFTVPFTNTSGLNGGPALTNWYWDFTSNGSVDNLTQNPTNDFLAAGVYSVELKVSNGGCTDSITKIVTVTPNPTANFITSSSCLNSITNFTSTATPTLGLSSHAWNFGDGSPNGSGATPAHTYTSSGTFNITYTVTNSSGCTDVITKTVTISPNPVVAISSNTVCLNLTTLFTNSTTIGAPDVISTWAWDFDNNGTIDNNSQFPTNTYTTVGTHTAELAVTSNNGCKDSLTIPVVVNDIQTGLFSASNACLNSAITLTNSTTVVAPNSISVYSWDFGSGASPATGTGFAPPLPTYTTSGIKTITLSLTANTTCTAAITQTIEIYAQPVANFSATSVCQSIATAFTDLSTPTGSITAWAWDFTNNGSVDNTTNAPSTIYASAGTYSVSLIVTDNHTCKDTVVLPLNVWGHAIPDFTATTVCFGATTSFSNSTNTTTNANVGGTPTWSWNYGDGLGSSSNQDPLYLYTTAGVSVYNVTLTATTTNNCIDNVVKTVTVNVLPTVAFTAVSACLNMNVILNNTSAIAVPDNISGHAWNFGIGSTPTATSAVQTPLGLTYTVSGIKTITLTVTANTTCTATITRTVNVFPQPIANFSTTSVCQSTSTAFTDLSLPMGSMTAWAWDFTNDGSVDNTTNAPGNVYASSGTFTASLIVTDNNTCKDTVVLPLNVWGHAIPDFTPSNVCFGTVSTFTNLTNTTTNPNVGGTPTWTWDFGDGSPTNSSQNPTYTYTSSASTVYNVTLTATTTNNCIDNVVKTVTVNVLPTATFTPINACLNSNVVLNNTSVIAAPDNISTYTWNFGIGSAPTSTSAVQNPLGLTYTSSGIKTITLTITANTTCSASITNTVNIFPQPVANFSTTSVCQSTSTAFTDLSVPTGSMTGWAWDFTNDGSVDNTTNAPGNVYASSGTFTASLIVTDNNSCKDTVVLALNVWGHSIPNFTATTVCLGSVSTFSNMTNTTTNANVGGIPSWAWNFGDGSPINSSSDPTYTYTSNIVYTYSVVLTATTTNGCVDNITKVVTVNIIPTATFTPVNACLNTNVVLNNTSSIPIPDNISTYAWDFGVGAAPTTTSTTQNPPVLTYNSSGIKTITLTITANTSCTATITNTVTIYPQPVANFSTTSVCQSTATAFTDLSTPTGSITGWAWDFTNNGTSDNATNSPSNIFPTSGTYTTSLIVTDNNTCKDTIKLPLDVWGHTIPDFTPDKVCFGTLSAFTNLTDETINPNVGSGSTYVWDFADTSPITTIINPGHTYTINGNVNSVFNVTLTATSLHNCVDFIIKPVSVYAVPTASFTSDSVCFGSISHLTDASNGHGNVVNTYVWDFLSNGTTDVSGIANPNFIFPAFGNNNVTYTVSTSPVFGLICSNTTNTIQVWVNPNPVPDFTFVNKCINAQPNTFNGSPSTIAMGSNVMYLWAYGDAAVSTPTAVSATTHVYGAAGIYNTTLTVTSNKGCQSIISKQVEVYQKPFMNFISSNPCDQTAMTFTAITQPNSGTITNWFWDYNNSITSFEGAGQTSNFTFTGPGSHTVSLVSETNNGCKDTIGHTVYVNYVPIALFNVDKPSGCPKHCVEFTDATLPITTPGQIIQWQWTLGDGTTVTNGTNANVSHCYINNSSNQLAQYNVQLVVTTDSGCVNTINKLNYITVFPKPIANYTVNPNAGNVVEPLEYFTNQSQDYTKWWWLFGDNSPLDSVNVDPTHFYSSATADTYYSVLLVANQYGCMDTAYVPVEIGPEFTFYIPNAFSPSNDDGINDFFTGKGIGIATYEMWIFDRWGEKIFYTQDIETGWNGRVQGKSKEGKQEVYVWKVKLSDVLGKKHEYIGHVTLLR